MPLREFFCDKCGYEVVLFDHSGTKPNPKCLGCGEKIDIKISKSNFKLRGFGWSEDGYSKNIDDVEEAWARDGKPVGPHVRGKERFYARKKAELETQINKNLS